MFRTIPLYIIRSFSLYTQQWYMSYRFCWQLASGILIPLELVPSWSHSLAVSKTCMTYTIAVCTVKNSWWWTEELPETCKILFQNKFEKLVYLVGFVIRISYKHRDWLPLLHHHHHHHWHNSPFWAKAFFRSFCQLSLWQSDHCFFGFHNNIFFRSRLSALRPTPSNPGGPIGLLLSLGLRHVPIWHGRPYQ